MSMGNEEVGDDYLGGMAEWRILFKGDKGMGYNYSREMRASGTIIQED